MKIIPSAEIRPSFTLQSQVDCHQQKRRWCSPYSGWLYTKVPCGYDCFLSDISSLLDHRQLCYGVKGGVESAVHVARYPPSWPWCNKAQLQECTQFFSAGHYALLSLQTCCTDLENRVILSSGLQQREPFLFSSVYPFIINLYVCFLNLGGEVDTLLQDLDIVMSLSD
jgi:hypothetical protein